VSKWLRGIVQTEWLPDGRSVRLLSLLQYIDDQEQAWQAPEGLVSDGASIPRVFWWLIGSPFTGKYRRGAVVHDAYHKDHKGRSRKAVDKVFYQIMREDGVRWWKAQSIYWAVRVGGNKAWRQQT